MREQLGKRSSTAITTVRTAQGSDGSGMWYAIAFVLVIAATFVCWWLVERWCDARHRRLAGRSPIATEIAAMQAARRVRDAEAAAEQYMERFIEERGTDRGSAP